MRPDESGFRYLFDRYSRGFQENVVQRGQVFQDISWRNRDSALDGPLEPAVLRSAHHDFIQILFELQTIHFARTL